MTRAIIAMLVAAVLAIAGWAIHESGLDAGRAEIQAKWEEQRIKDAAAAVQANLQARDREQALQSTVDRIRQEKTHEIRHLSAARDAALRELRNRDERPAVVGDAASVADPAGPGPAASCTGDKLFRQDAEFLVWEAARADEVRAHLSECRAAYESAREVTE